MLILKNRDEEVEDDNNKEDNNIYINIIDSLISNLFIKMNPGCSHQPNSVPPCVCIPTMPIDPLLYPYPRFIGKKKYTFQSYVLKPEK